MNFEIGGVAIYIGKIRYIDILTEKFLMKKYLGGEFHPAHPLTFSYKIHFNIIFPYSPKSLK